MQVTQTFTANQRIDYHEPGDFFRVLSASAALNVKFYKNGKEISDAPLIGAGYAEKFDSQAFDRVSVQSPTAQTVQLATRFGNQVFYDAPPVGAVTVQNTGGAFTQTNPTVTSASAQLLAANTARRYLLIQNKDADGIIYVTLNGTAATVANGIAVEPGGALEIQGYAPTGAINAIGSIASNPNIVVVGG